MSLRLFVKEHPPPILQAATCSLQVQQHDSIAGESQRDARTC
jgi:hypothetical protein